MSFQTKGFKFLKVLVTLLFKVVLLCFYAVSSLIEIILKNINQYIKLKL